MKTTDKPSDQDANHVRLMSRSSALQALASRAGKPQPPTPIPAPIRFDCTDGKCGYCHSCRGTQQVPVMIRIQKGGAQ